MFLQIEADGAWLKYRLGVETELRKAISMEKLIINRLPYGATREEIRR
jgi:hypothetical protein